MKQNHITDDLSALLSVLPSEFNRALERENQNDDLLEIIMDLGRVPVARYIDHELTLSEKEITHDMIQDTVSRIGEFDGDNRAGIERTLHRISAIRNKKGDIIGLTLRVGRAVYGTIDIIEDLVKSEKSILLLGKPGIGKTTMLREAARIRAENSRVVIVDTSNEIGGDGDVPHPAVGRARRMQVSNPLLQHEVMIEAVENHNPEVIVIDEIGREMEALAARTIAERGVQLIATAHGRTLENLLLNPTLSDLIGGIESVTLSDEEARRRGTQKTVLERRAPPTFDVLIEIQDRDHLAIHQDVAASVDALVRGYPLEPQIRMRDESGKINTQEPQQRVETANAQAQGLRRQNNNGSYGNEEKQLRSSNRRFESAAKEQQALLPPINVFPFGVARNRLLEAIRRLGLPAKVVHDLQDADVFITLKSYYRSRQRPILQAEERGIPIYVLRANSENQMEQALAEIFNLGGPSGRPLNYDRISQEVHNAVDLVLAGKHWVDLPPASAKIRRIQHELVREAELTSHSYGKEPNRYVRVFRE
ncbi:MAG TPA: R3H domain-containing nucleic acid-binding protein [Anaerolineaceae bacterium]|jgi:stage III sporulation protein SpoIIIAA|nr:R3H domain-containing nucleic acid-binding protein [Anaerolineaceae bacterium]